MHYSKPVNTSVEKGLTLSLNQCPKTDQEKEKMKDVPYANVVGSLMYGMLCTRSGICFAVGLVSRYQSNPRPTHWQTVKRIMRYLRGTTDLVICYQGGDLRLRGYSYADWGDDPDESRSTSGCVFTLSRRTIWWCSKEQDCITLSTMETGYIARSIATQEAIWLRHLLQNINLTTKVDNTVALLCDNTTIQFALCKTRLLLSITIIDPLTKSIPRDALKSHMLSLGLRRV